MSGDPNGRGISQAKETTPRPPLRYLRYLGGAFIVLLMIAFIGPIEPGIPPRHAWSSIELQKVSLITHAMLRYAQDHQGKFPTGESSTQVFQKLLEGGYVDYYASSASLFYLPLKGKTPPLSGQPLKPENVCFDVTSSADGSLSDGLPLVFSSGFEVSYEPGASAKRLAPPEFRWPGFELFRPDPGPSHDYMVVGYKQAQVSILFVKDDKINPNGSAPGFIPSNFNADGRTYQQLTPDGVLPNE